MSATEPERLPPLALDVVIELRSQVTNDDVVMRYAEDEPIGLTILKAS
ncbi:MAG: hypothetical protein VKK80_01860 [Prochlorothrix sp.]|nr:hypothetical protein [Prochlorothrix sp.]